jgi:hypothetical protein
MNAFLNFLFYFFPFRKKNDSIKYDLKIKDGSSYGILRGDYYGEIFVFIEEKDSVLYFISIPKMEIRKVDVAKFDFGLKNNIIEFNNIIPKEVFNFLKTYFKKLNKTVK